MAVFYNSSAVINSLSIANLTVGALSATTSVTGTVQSANTGAIVITANSTTGANLFSRLVFSNSNGMTFGVAAAANSIVLTASTAGAIIVSGGTTSGTLSTLVFTNANSVSFGIATAANSVGSATITASYTVPSPLSYFNYPHGPFLGSTFTNLVGTLTAGGSTNIIQPFNLPYPVSFNCLRLPVFQNAASSTNSNSTAVSTVGTGAFSQTVNMYGNIYTLGTGTQSSALLLANSFSFASTMYWSFSYSNSTSNTYGYGFSFGRNNSTTFITSITYSSATAAIHIITSGLTDFTGNRFADIIVTNGLSLAENPYWLGIQVSLSTQTAGVYTITTGVFSNGMLTFSNFVNTQYASGFGLMNAASTHLKLGGGFWTTNARGATSSTLALSNVVTNASNVEVPFEMMNWV